MNVFIKTLTKAVAASVLLVICSDAVSADGTPGFEQIVKENSDLKVAITEERTKRSPLDLEDVPSSSDLSCSIKFFEKIYGQLDRIINGQNVAFYAWVSAPIENIQPWATIVFSTVQTNIGNGYNSVTGEFTAPVSGIYAFYSNILSAVDKHIETSLQVNGVNKMYVYSGGKYYGPGSNMAVLHLNVEDVVKMVKHGPWGKEPFYIHNSWSGKYYGPGSNLAVLHLNAGDVVKMVKHGPWGTKPFYIHDSWSSFSGYLVRADGADLAPGLTSTA